nr:TlpA disulfide reductase family protein [Streptomyces sp. SPB074]
MKSIAPRSRLLSVALTICCLSLAACSSSSGSGSSQIGFVAGDSGVSTVPKAKRGKPIEITGKSLQGKPLDLAGYRDSIVVLNVWGSWCPPCRAEASNLTKVATEYKNKQVDFIGINTRDDNTSLPLGFEKTYKIKYPSFFDPSGRIILNAFPPGTLNPQSIPTTIVLDRDGKIAARAIGAVSTAKLKSMLDPLLA